jgi:Fic family protein
LNQSPQNKRRLKVMDGFIHQLAHWPEFYWDSDIVSSLLGEVRHRHGRLLGRMEGFEGNTQEMISIQSILQDVLNSIEIEEVSPDEALIRFLVAERMGIKIPAPLLSENCNAGFKLAHYKLIEMILDASLGFMSPLNKERLFYWHAALFPRGRTGVHKIVTGAWRKNADNDPMQVVTGPINNRDLHFEAPASNRITIEMKQFLDWFNTNQPIDPVIKAAIAHLWFVTIHPFDDGNGRIARTLTDLQLSRAEGCPHRFYSLSAQIRKDRDNYYGILERTQKGDLNITDWLEWFLISTSKAIDASYQQLLPICNKARFWSQHRETSLNDRQILLLNKLLDGLENSLNSSRWALLTKASQDTALRDIRDLLQKNILVKESGGGRSTRYHLRYSTNSLS